jgi:hypothetical protein
MDDIFMKMKSDGFVGDLVLRKSKPPRWRWHISIVTISARHFAVAGRLRFCIKGVIQ